MLSNLKKCLTVFAILVVVLPVTLRAQVEMKTEPPKKTEVIIQFKVFDANDPGKQYHPDLSSRPIIFLRNLQTKKDEVYLGTSDKDIAIVQSKTREGFYEITLPAGRLINDLAIDLIEPNTNAAAIIKVVTANDIVTYPGASTSAETFAFTPYVAQLGVYRNLMTELLDQFPDRRVEIAGVLEKRFSGRLVKMQDVLDERRVTFAALGQDVTARKVLNDVLELYEILPSHPNPNPTPITNVNPIAKTSPDCYYYPCRRGLFHRWR